MGAVLREVPKIKPLHAKRQQKYASLSREHLLTANIGIYRCSFVLYTNVAYTHLYRLHFRVSEGDQEWFFEERLSDKV